MKYILPIIIGIIYLVPVSSQTSFLNFHQLTVEEGLSESTNDFLYMDKNKFTWIGSLDGLNLFDGKEVIVFKSKSNTSDLNNIRGIDIQSPFFEDENGDIWFTTGEAINCYRSKEGKFNHFLIKTLSDTTSGVHRAFHLDAKQILWVIANGKLFKFNTKEPAKIIDYSEEFTHQHAVADIDDRGIVRSIFAFNSGVGKGFEVRKYSDNHNPPKKEYKFNKEGNLTDPSYTIYQVIPNIKNGVEACFLTDQGLLFFASDKSNSYRIIPFPKDFQSVVNMAKIGNRLYLVNNTSEIIEFDLTNETFSSIRHRTFNLDEKKELNDINRIFMGRDSILWVATNENGVFFANMKNQRSFSLFKRNNILEHPVHSLFEDSNGNIWGVSENGKAWVFDSKKRIKDTIVLPPYFRSIQTNDQIWAISSKGVGTLKAGNYNFDWTPLSDKNEMIFDIIPYNSKYLLLATSQGIRSFDINSNKSKLLYPDLFIVKIFLDTKERLWFANGSDQLKIIQIEENDSKPVLQNDLIKMFSNMGIMNHITEDTLRHYTLIGTSKGLVSISEDLSKKNLLTETEDLTNQYIHAVLTDKNSNIWLSTNRGITRFNPDLKGTSRFKNFSSRDGLSTEVYNSGSILLSKRNELWYGSTKGIDVIEPDIQNIGTAPKLAIKNLKIHNKKWSGEKSINDTKKIILPDTANTLTFELAALEYTDPVRNKFKAYLIHKNNIDSTFLGTNNSITYANLSPGNYKFQFTACNAEGIWQKQKHELEIIINPPFYQTWWFRTLTTITIIAFVVFLSTFYYRYQLRGKELELQKQKSISQQKQQALDKMIILKEERKRIAADMHDDILSDLTMIIIKSYSEFNTMEAEKSKALSIINKKANSLEENLRVLIWALNNEYDSLADLVNLIKDHASNYFEDQNIKLSIKPHDNIPELAIKGTIIMEVFKVVKEVLHNVVKHAEATKVFLSLIFNNDNSIIIIEDNGKGFKKKHEKNESGNGMKNCKSRLKKIGGQIHWEESKKGVKATITLKLGRLKNEG